MRDDVQHPYVRGRTTCSAAGEGVCVVAVLLGRDLWVAYTVYDIEDELEYLQKPVVVLYSGSISC